MVVQDANYSNCVSYFLYKSFNSVILIVCLHCKRKNKNYNTHVDCTIIMLYSVVNY